MLLSKHWSVCLNSLTHQHWFNQWCGFWAGPSVDQPMADVVSVWQHLLDNFFFSILFGDTIHFTFKNVWMSLHSSLLLPTSIPKANPFSDAQKMIQRNGNKFAQKWLFIVDCVHLSGFCYVHVTSSCLNECFSFPHQFPSCMSNVNWHNVLFQVEHWKF